MCRPNCAFQFIFPYSFILHILPAKPIVIPISPGQVSCPKTDSKRSEQREFPILFALSSVANNASHSVADENSCASTECHHKEDDTARGCPLVPASVQRGQSSALVASWMGNFSVVSFRGSSTSRRHSTITFEG